MPRKTKAQIIEDLRREAKRVRDRNYRFRKMPLDRQRITIAKDVLDLLKAEKIRAESGTYLQLDEDIMLEHWGDDWEDVEPEEGAEKVQIHKLIEASPTCDVCGIGACFVAAVRRNDQCTVSDMESSDDDNFMRDYLSTWFSKRELQLIECAFEQSSGFVTYEDQESYNAYKFGDAIDDDGERLEAIFKNIAENGGKFFPPYVSMEGDDELDDDDEDLDGI